MKLRGTIHVIGRVGPFALDGNALVRLIFESITSGGEKISVLISDKVVVCDLERAEVVNMTPVQQAIEIHVEIDDALAGDHPSLLGKDPA